MGRLSRVPEGAAPAEGRPGLCLGQVNDWMAEIYPMWVAAHGVMIVTLVNWYQAAIGSLIGAGHAALLDRTIGYYRPYATSHEDLDADKSFQAEIRNAARCLVQAVRPMRSGKLAQTDARLAWISTEPDSPPWKSRLAEVRPK